MARPVLFQHPASLAHETGAHPERPARIAAVGRALEDRDWLGYEVRESPAAARAWLEAIHDPAYVDCIERFCAAGGGMLDPDTVASPGSFEAAVRAAGGGVALVDALLGGEAAAGAALHRPPGHHALSARAMGFCLFANVAIAARHAQRAHGLERVMVVDYDIHHGNGTNDLFHDDPSVLFASLHQWPFWPGSGRADDIGAGAGQGYTVNVPVPGGSGDPTWTSVVEHVFVPLGRAYAPQLVLVSAGFDAHADDPLGGCTVTDAGFVAMAGSVRRLADGLGVPVGVVLEGGYDLGALARGVVGTLEVLGAAEAPPADDALPVDAIARGAIERLQGRWPALVSA